jgi:hypothetical protein
MFRLAHDDKYLSTLYHDRYHHIILVYFIFPILLNFILYKLHHLEKHYFLHSNFSTITQFVHLPNKYERSEIDLFSDDVLWRGHTVVHFSDMSLLVVLFNLCQHCSRLHAQKPFTVNWWMELNLHNSFDLKHALCLLVNNLIRLMHYQVYIKWLISWMIFISSRCSKH